jgi:hypothetical protein
MIFHQETPSYNILLLTSSATVSFSCDAAVTTTEVRHLDVLRRNHSLCLDDNICSSFFLPGDDIHALLSLTVISLVMALKWCYSDRIVDHSRHVITTLWVVELIGRCLDFFEISDQTDAVTVYFVVWQLTSMMWAWTCHQFPSPILRIEQIVTCISMSIVSFTIHHCAFRYLPRAVSLASLWMLSFADMYV